MKNDQTIEIWVKPEIHELGDAKNLVAASNTVGGGDIEYNVLNPS
ncbi:MAG: hypothetical protein ACJ0G1_08440 [Gammaproteobacteria bacterium]